MIEFVIKSTISFFVLYSMYYVLLRNLKTFEFNRFYLLLTVIFSLTIPFVHFATDIKFPVSQNIQEYSFSISNINVRNTIDDNQVLNNTLNLSDFLEIIYLIVSIILTIRFIVNFSKIIKTIKNSECISKKYPSIVLATNNSLPYSFLNYIILNKKEYELGNIGADLILHEQTHCSQKHSIDILFIEIVKIFLWFNPLIWIIKKEMQINHEYLADKSVLQSQHLANYQNTLLNQVFRNNSTYLASDFNYSFTKKRLIMINRSESFITATLKQMVVSLMVLGIGFLFITKINAQDTKEAATKHQQQSASSQSVASPELLKEYQDIINKYKKTSNDGKVRYSLNLNQADKDRLETIFFQMSQEQQANQKFVFIASNTIYLKKNVTTKEQLESYKDPKKYGIWINGKRVSNDVLNNYENTDFAQASVSKLMKNAINFGKHLYQVDLMTNEYYQQYIDDILARKDYMLVGKNN